MFTFTVFPIRIATTYSTVIAFAWLLLVALGTANSFPLFFFALHLGILQATVFQSVQVPTPRSLANISTSPI